MNSDFGVHFILGAIKDLLNQKYDMVTLSAIMGVLDYIFVL